MSSALLNRDRKAVDGSLVTQFEWSAIAPDLWYYYEIHGEEEDDRLLRGIIEASGARFDGEPLVYRAMLYLPYPDENTTADLKSAKVWLEEAAAKAHLG